MISGYRAVVLVPAQQEPVTLADVKTHCRIPTSGEDSYITNFLIPAARDRAEKYLRRYLCEQVVRIVFDAFSWNRQFDTYGYNAVSSGALIVPVGPVRSVQLITYQDGQNEQQTLATTEYEYDLHNEPARIYPAYNKYWPSLSGQPGAISLDLVVGYPPGNNGSPTDFAANIPPAIKQAILMDCANLYEIREVVNIGNITSEYPHGWDALLWPYRLLT